MANEIRTRTNFVGGLVEDAPLLVDATTLTSASLANLPVIDGTNHAALIIDPDGNDGNSEIVWITAHTASATTATILRGQEGTTARQHTQDTPWVHTSTARDYEGTFLGTRLRMTLNQSVASATWAIINWDAEEFDTPGWHDTVTNNSRITVDRTGYYEVSAVGGWVANGAGARYMAFTKNGTRIIQLPDGPPGAILFSHHFADTLLLAAGDYLELSVYQDSGGALDFRSGESYFNVRFLGY